MQGQHVTPAPRLVRSRYRATAYVLDPLARPRVAFARLQPLRVLRFALDAPRTHPPPRGLPLNQKQTLAARQRLRDKTFPATAA